MNDDFIGVGVAFPLRTDATGGWCCYRDRQGQEAIPIHPGMAPARGR